VVVIVEVRRLVWADVAPEVEAAQELKQLGHRTYQVDDKAACKNEVALYRVPLFNN
jgi:hypothetical protein